MGYLVGALTAVALRMGPPRAIRLGLALVVLSTVAMGVTHAMGVRLALRFGAGVASAWVLVFASAWCLEQLQRDAAEYPRALLGAIVFSGVGIGIAVTGVVCVLLLARGASSATTWIALGVLALAVSASIWGSFGAERTAPSASRARGEGWNADFSRMVLCSSRR